jgi:two-component system, LuxR family, sensor kinase FixL
MHRAPLATSMLRSVGEPRAVDVPQVLRVVRNAIMFAVCYAAAARFTSGALSAADLPPALFIPSAFVLTALLLTPPARWWTVLASGLVGHWLASIGQGTSLAALLGSFAIDAVSTVVAAMLIRRYVDLTWELSTLPAMSVFTVIALVAPLIGLLGSAALFRIQSPVHGASGDAFGNATTAWIPWFIIVLANSLAYLTVVPAGLAIHAAVRNAFAAESRSMIRWTRLVEAVVFAGAVVFVSIVLFAQWPRDPIARALVLTAPVPLVLGAGLRFGLAGAASTLVIGACVAMRGVVHGIAPFPAPSTAGGVIAQQLVFLALATPLLFLAAVSDERRRLATQLAQSDARYALATQAGRVFLYGYDATSGAVHADPALGELLGVASLELQSPTWWWRRVHPDDTANLQRAWASRRGSTGVAAGATDFRMLDRDGHVRWFRERPSPRSLLEPESVPHVGTVTDITELKAAELAAAQRSRELAHVARTSIVGELAAALAHEIRQPLTAILINSQTAMRVLDAQPRDPDAVREILQQLAADGRRAGEVIQRVRAFAKKDEVERGPIDLNIMLREAVQLVRHDTIRRRVEIRFALTHETLIVVGDRVQLQQVALNLVLNALEALADRPADSQRLVLIETARAASHTAIITVRDTGPGIALERQAAIFEPFITSKPNGLGVGLSISRTIVEAHGGVIWCESDPSVGGAAFIVAIPLGAARRP